MQEVGNQVVSDDEILSYVYVKFNLWKPEMSVMLEDDCVGIWWSDTYGRYIFESSDGENIRIPWGR